MLLLVLGMQLSQHVFSRYHCSPFFILVSIASLLELYLSVLEILVSFKEFLFELLDSITWWCILLFLFIILIIPIVSIVIFISATKLIDIVILLRVHIILITIIVIAHLCMVLFGDNIDFISNVSEDCSSITVLLLRVVSVVLVTVTTHHLLDLLVIGVLILSINVAVLFFFFFLIVTIESTWTDAKPFMRINLLVFIVAWTHAALLGAPFSAPEVNKVVSVELFFLIFFILPTAIVTSKVLLCVTQIRGNLSIQRHKYPFNGLIFLHLLFDWFLLKQCLNTVKLLLLLAFLLHLLHILVLVTHILLSFDFLFILVIMLRHPLSLVVLIIEVIV